MIEPRKGTECYELLRALKSRRQTTRGVAVSLGITSFHRRMTDLRLMGHTILQEDKYEYDDRGKVVKKWKEYWVETKPPM